MKVSGLLLALLAAAVILVACGDAEERATGKIAFVSDRDGNSEIYVVKADGSGVTQLTNNPAGIILSFAWSPDGSRIAFATEFDSAGNYAIRTVDADGSGLVNLTEDVHIGQVFWSPDGARIAFLAGRRMYIMNADGSGVAQLAKDLPDVSAWVWSPDWLRIAFASSRGELTDLYVTNADGTELTRLTDAPMHCGFYGFGCITWSPDGRRIVYEADSDLYLVNADGSGLTRLTDQARAVFPAWSPDGSRIAFASNRDGNFEIYVMNADGSGVTNLTNHPASDGRLAWSPDGSRITFICNRNGNDEICVMNADGSGLTNLTNDPGDDGGLYIAWSPVP